MLLLIKQIDIIINNMFYSHITSFILSQVFGIYLVIFAILMLSRPQYFREFFTTLKPNDHVIMLSGTIGLLFGLVLVDIHNIWVLAPRVIITLLCWLISIKSILWLTMPEKMIKLTKRMYSGMGYYWVILTMVIIGSVLITRGFYLFLTLYPKHFM